MTDTEKTINEAKAEILPFDSWERLTGESSAAFAAFCVFRDFGVDRNIRKAIDGAQLKQCVEKNNVACSRNYNSWRNWAAQFRWKERAADYDRYIEGLKQTENRKTIEAQGEKHRAVTGKMLDVVLKKLETMNPADLTQGTVTEWVQTAIKAEREAANLISPNEKTDSKRETSFQGEFNFISDFQGL